VVAGDGSGLPAALEIEYRVRQAGETVWRDTWAGEPAARSGQDAWDVVRVLHLEGLPAGSYALEVSARLRKPASVAIDLGIVGRREIEIVDEFLPFARIMPLRAEGVDLARGHHEIGQQFLRRDDFEAAGEHFQAAVRLEPQISAYQIDAAKTLVIRGDLKMAGFFLDTALQREPRNAEAWATYGLLRVRQADFDLAIEAYRRSLDLAPGTPAIYNGLAESYLSTGQTALALAALEQSLEINPAQQQVRQLRDRLRGDGAYQPSPPNGSSVFPTSQ
jgi:tetratricopeptide (TPR) repeat protein